MLSNKNILIVLFESLGATYKFIQELKTEQVLEVFPLGQKGHLILFSQDSMKPLCERLDGTSEINRYFHIPDCSAKVLRSYLSVENAEVNASLLVLESSYIGDLFVLANQAVKQGLSIVDLRLLRGSSSASYLFLTGGNAEMKSFLAPVQNQTVKTTFIEEASVKIKELFAIQP